MQDRPINTNDLQYDLPTELIAQQPCRPRDAARLMVVHRRTGEIEHRVFADLPALLTPRDCLVVNCTLVLPAKFTARRRTGGRLNGLFLREETPGRWWVLLQGAGRVRQGEQLQLGDGRWLLGLVQRGERGAWLATVEPPDPAGAILEVVGATPLPPYIRRTEAQPAEADLLDREAYQTVYAREPGAVAAPTAGMHFTPELLQTIRAAGTIIAEVVLHVGLGTFRPIEVDDLSRHRMHAEWYSLSPDVAAGINAVRRAGGRAVAVGTTTVRVLETCAKTGPLQAQSGWTELFVFPPYSFHATDVLLTNFHLPGSTLLALVSAFAGHELLLKAYQVAVTERYRFYSYGDAMLIL